MKITAAQLRARGIKLPASDPAAGFRAIRSARSSMRPGDGTTPRPRIDPAMKVRVVLVEVQARNPLNGTGRYDWRKWAAHRKEHRTRTINTLLSAPGTLPPLPVRVTMTRHAPRLLDAWDALPAALKSVVDGVADAYGLSDDDPRFEWARPGQVKTRSDAVTKRSVWFVAVTIEHVANIDRLEGTVTK